MQYMTYLVACYLRYGGLVDRRDFKGPPLSFLEMFDMPGGVTIIRIPKNGSRKWTSQIQFIFAASSFTFSEFRFVTLYDKRIARSQLCVGNAVSQAKLMFRTRKRETTWVYAGEFKLRLSSLTWARPSQAAFAFIDSGRIAPASNETKCCAKRRCGTMSLPINVINMTPPINSYFYSGWTTRGKRYFYLGITLRPEK